VRSPAPDRSPAHGAAGFLHAAALALAWAHPALAHDPAPHASGRDAAAVPAAPVPNRWGANYFPNVTLITQDGKPVRFYEDLLKDKSVAINVIYTSCKDECPLETARLVQLQRLMGERMGRDIFFYSISIDPERDTPQVLKAYSEKYGVGPGWLFLTGRPEDIKAVVKKIGLSRGSDSANKDGHTASLMVGEVAGGQWMRNSAVDNPQFLAVTIGNFLGWRNPQPGRSYAEARPLDVGQGEYLFNSRCSACHTLGQGDRIGPDLAGVTARRDRAWLVRYVAEPDKVLAEGDAIAADLLRRFRETRMPNLRMGSADVAAVLAFLESRGAAAQARKEAAAR